MIEDGRVFAALAMAAVLLFLVERQLPPGSPWRRLLRLAAAATVGLGMAASLVSGLLWLGR